MTLQLLKSASASANSQMDTVNARTLILLSGPDQCLMNKDDIERLRGALPRCEVRELENNEQFLFLIQKQNQRLSSVKHDDIDSDFVHQELVADKVNKKKKQEKKKKTDVNKEVKKVDAVQKIVIKSRDDCNKGFVIPYLIDTTSDDQQPEPRPQPQSQPQQAEGSELVDITEKVRDEHNKLLSGSEETEEEKIRNAKLSATLNVLTSAINKLDAVGVPSKISYPPPPPYPVIGNSGLTCMRKDFVPSKAIYDPLKPVDPLRMEALTSYLRLYEQFPLDTKPLGVPSEVYFYRVLITPKAAWPDTKYGWLGDDRYLRQYNGRSNSRSRQEVARYVQAIYAHDTLSAKRNYTTRRT